MAQNRFVEFIHKILRFEQKEIIIQHSLFSTRNHESDTCAAVALQRIFTLRAGRILSTTLKKSSPHSRPSGAVLHNGRPFFANSCLLFWRYDVLFSPRSITATQSAKQKKHAPKKAITLGACQIILFLCIQDRRNPVRAYQPYTRKVRK